jgi:two-component system sensor histidine kinase KdpD
VDDAVLALNGRGVRVEDRPILRAFTDQLGVALRSRELQAEAAAANALAQANDLRTALLRAVSHDLRTPLATIKASSSMLVAEDLELTDEATDELHATIDHEADRLSTLIGNLLDMSRLQSGAFELILRDVGLDEIVAQALASLGERSAHVDADIPDSLPLIHTDAALVERAVANVIDNAVAFSPPSVAVKVLGSSLGDIVELRVMDRGPGIPAAQRDMVFQPNQRLGDHDTSTGVGLGLAVARGFIDAVGAALAIDDTPGGGATIIFTFKAAR